MTFHHCFSSAEEKVFEKYINAIYCLHMVKSQKKGETGLKFLSRAKREHKFLSKENTSFLFPTACTSLCRWQKHEGQSMAKSMAPIHSLNTVLHSMDAIVSYCTSQWVGAG